MPKSAKQMLDILLAAVIVELRKNGTDDVCSATKFPGEGVALDYADCGGMLWVRLTSAAPSASFPAPVQDLNNCAKSLAFPVEVGLMRPAPIPANFVTGEMDLPDDEDHSAATDKQLDDMEAMYRGIRAAAKDIEYLIVGTYSPQGPTGGTVGGVWSLTVGDD
jgi:hypothetical protein